LLLIEEVRQRAPLAQPAGGGRAHQATDPALAAALARRFALTPREAEVALVLSRGINLREVAQELGIGIATVRSHLQHLFEKTGTHRQVELILLLRSLGA
jgi:DNA-binding CsgD family transcriptional regulator